MKLSQKGQVSQGGQCARFHNQAATIIGQISPLSRQALLHAAQTNPNLALELLDAIGHAKAVGAEKVMGQARKKLGIR